MAITASDIQYRLSVSAAAGDTTAQPDPNASLGDQASTTQVAETVNAFFDKITGPENAASESEYRCFFVYNAHATLTWENVVVWISSDTGGGANIALGVDPAAATDIDAATQQASIAADENTAPSPAVTFTTYAAGSAIDTKARGLSIGNLAPDACRAVWIKRTATNSAAINNDGCTIRCEGDTAA